MFHRLESLLHLLPQLLAHPGRLVPPPLVGRSGHERRHRHGLAVFVHGDHGEVAAVGMARDLRLGKYSKGMLQRVGLAQALIHSPELLVLDEPSEGLAPIIIEALEAVLKGVKAAGIPILLVEQNYHLAARLADYVYVLSQGRVQFSGETKALIDNEDVRGTYLSV